MNERQKWALLPFLIIGALILFPAATAKLLGHALAGNGEGATINQSIAESNRVDAQTGVFRAHGSAVDGITETAILATTEFACVSSGQTGVPLRPSIVAGARFSVAGQSATFRYVAVYKNAAGTNRIKDLSDTFTLTASTLTDSNGLYIAGSQIVPAMGGNYGRLVLITAPASGTVSSTLGSY